MLASTLLRDLPPTLQNYTLKNKTKQIEQNSKLQVKIISSVKHQLLNNY